MTQTKEELTENLDLLELLHDVEVYPGITNNLGKGVHEDTREFLVNDTSFSQRGQVGSLESLESSQKIHPSLGQKLLAKLGSRV